MGHCATGTGKSDESVFRDVILGVKTAVGADYCADNLTLSRCSVRLGRKEVIMC